MLSARFNGAKVSRAFHNQDDRRHLCAHFCAIARSITHGSIGLAQPKLPESEPKMALFGPQMDHSRGVTP